MAAPKAYVRHRGRTPRGAAAWQRLALFMLLALVALQLYFLLRIALMALVNPSSTTMQRSEIARLARTHGQVAWAQGWTDSHRLGTQLKRAVIASEDARFVDHSGVEWDAIERAWERNQQPATPASARLVGGSTITQQLAKNLLLSGERNHARKVQEWVLTWWLEAFLTKDRILTIYLNHVEWGEGLFGATSAARYYHRVEVDRLSRWQAARLAVMLPSPKRFEKRPQSPYLAGRATQIAAAMDSVELP